MKQPKIRLKGYKGQWENGVIGDIATFSKGRGYSKSDLRPEGNPIILYGRLYTNYSSIIESVDTFASLQNGSVLSKGNEVIIPGSGETPEDIAIASSVAHKDVILGGDLNIVTFDSEKVVPAFAALSITNSKTHYELVGYAQGKTVVHLHNSSISKGHISYPSTDEQLAIVSYISSIDSLIQSTAKKIESLKQVKAASLQSMFPQEGETTPRVRFKGFEGEWAEATLSEVGKCISGIGFPEQEQGGCEGFPFYKVSDMNNIGNETVMNISNNYVTSEQVERNGWKVCTDVPAIYFAKVGAAVLLNRKRLVLRHCLCDNNTMLYSFDKKKWDAQFCLSCFESIDLTKLVQVGSLPSYNGSMVGKIRILLPQFDEQKQIGAFFQNLDSQITLQNQRLEKLKQIKSACLDNMFV